MYNNLWRLVVRKFLRFSDDLWRGFKRDEGSHGISVSRNCNFYSFSFGTTQDEVSNLIERSNLHCV